MNVSLRELRDTDLPLLLAWAHIKKIWTYLPTSRAGENLTWKDHFDWWRSREQREDWMILMDSDNYGPRPVGVVIINLKSGEIGIYIGEVTLWGLGVGEKALKLGVDRTVELGYSKIWAVIHPRNKRSQRLFKACGFVKTGKGRRNLDLYEYIFGGPEVPVPVNQTGNRLSYHPSPT